MDQKIEKNIFLFYIYDINKNMVENKYAKKKHYKADLLHYVKLDTQDKYYNVYILNRLTNKLEKQWGVYNMDDKLKNIFFNNNNKNAHWAPRRLSKTALYEQIRSCIIDQPDNYINIIETINTDRKNKVTRIVI